ncbi:MAG: YkgJ family cysteine cluster protein [Proteobacteria bacterium]|nr:YkgJ family cysteine cluster protein [Pseudomonadota bacterium]MBU1595328.1 YkgJ family cysteine cluster protein [Pseudomonadota bacterium]
MAVHPILPQRRLTITLDRASGDISTVAVDIPDAPAPFPAIMPAIRAVADAFQHEAQRVIASLGRAVTCRHGCDACCKHLVVLGEAEALAVLQTLRALPQAQRRRATDRFQDGLRRLESAGLLPRLFAVFTHEAHDWRRVGEMQAAYWELTIPCPFLEDGACGIYSQRPLICRQYAMTSPPAACETPFSPQTGLEKVLPALDLAGAAAAFDGQFAHASQVMPLLFCLLRQGHLAKRAFPALDPATMLARFLDFASEHYGRKA